MPYVRTVKTTSGATAVQIVWSSRRGSRKIEHIGSAHDEAELEALKAAARQRLAAGQVELDLGLGGPGPAARCRSPPRGWGTCWTPCARRTDVLGFERRRRGRRGIPAAGAGPDHRAGQQAGQPAGPGGGRGRARRRTARSSGACRPMRKEEWRQRLSEACAAHARLGPASLVLYDVSTLYFETDQGDGFREPGFSKERRLEPQITIGLLTGQDGFPLMVSAFEGNRAETKTMLPVIEKFMAAHRLPDVTVVADAGMISEANQKAIEAAGLSFILGMKIPDVPYQVAQWRREHPGEDIPDGHVFTQPWPAGPSSKRRDQMIYYQYRADRARRTLRGIDEQVAKAAKAVAGLAPVKRNRFIALDGAVKSVNRELEAKARDLAGLKGYVTNLAACPDGTPGHRGLRDRQLPRALEHRESLPHVKADLQARPVYHRKRDSIEAHLTIVFAALAVSRWIEAPDRLVHQEVRQAPPAATAPSQIQAGQHIITAADPLPDDLRDALALIK